MKQKFIQKFDKIIVSKVGNYNNQSLKEIIYLKKWEEQNNGKIWWGYQKNYPKPELINSFLQGNKKDVLFLMIRKDKGDNFLISDFPSSIKKKLVNSHMTFKKYRISIKDNWKKCRTYTGCDKAFIFKDLSDACYYIDTSCYQIYCDLGKCAISNNRLNSLDTHFNWIDHKSIHGTRFDTFCAND